MNCFCGAGENWLLLQDRWHGKLMERLLKFHNKPFIKHLLPHAEERLPDSILGCPHTDFSPTKELTILETHPAKTVTIDGAKNLRVAVFGDKSGSISSQGDAGRCAVGQHHRVPDVRCE